jgi:hypothetical protein
MKFNHCGLGVYYKIYLFAPKRSISSLLWLFRFNTLFPSRVTIRASFKKVMCRLPRWMSQIFKDDRGRKWFAFFAFLIFFLHHIKFQICLDRIKAKIKISQLCSPVDILVIIFKVSWLPLYFVSPLFIFVSFRLKTS